MPRHPHLSPTSATLSRSVFDALNRLAERHSKRIYPLNLGDSWMEPLAAARVEAQRVSERPRLHAYPPPAGEPALLEAIAERLARRSGLAVEVGALQVTAGATAGLSVSCQALLDPGDEVLLPSPFWPLIRGMIASRGAVPVEVPLWTRLDEPGFDVEAALEEAATDRTCAIYLNTPHNPTGRVLPAAHLDAIARVAERHDLWVFSDEVYEELWFGDGPPAPAWAREDLRSRTIATHSFSKAYALAGARVGFSHGPLEAMRAIRAVHAHQVYCAARPMQLCALAALRGGDEWLAEARRAYGEAGRTAASALGLPPPESGTFLFFDASPWSEGDDALPFLERCARAGVLLTPGAYCGRHHAASARLCFTAVPPKELGEALEILRDVMES